ncbi:hypothetical protein CONLIGDRAFT_682585 [Coniochaeta ligniaria NRRL 30616]|uniref:Protein prenylyltransferase n=1 Tax=Coniochaeta ligniaria NRRL 30616 TaxID=1408157 RepID=A0A1J7JCV6_9PEZI|nr:hypothetical protein CONLIGDRAFT_682585 [Coniochaeta ligniaria NRRL 30616]
MPGPLEDVLGDKQLRREALKAISDAIDPAAHDGLMEIEVLGQTMFPPRVFALRDGPAIAVNKSGLRAAYFEALEDVGVFSHANDADQAPAEHDNVAEKLNSLAVLVLMQPEYLTAINLRKSLLVSVSAEDGPGLTRYRGLVRLEKKFIDSLLTSPLNKHNKSPTLWSHRRWLVPRLVQFGLMDILRDLTEVVMVAGEKHPRNYYAWHHARYLMTLVDWNREETGRDVLRAVLDWCKRHHDDTSGWSFLQSLLSTEGRYEQESVSRVLKDVLGLAYSLRWTNESVWVFLRTIAASKLSREPEYHEFLRTVAALEAGIEDERAKKVLRTGAAWCVVYRQNTKVAGT